MDDLISRQEAYKVLTDYYHHKTEIQHIGLKEALNRVPYAQPEIIRCKDCNWFGKAGCAVEIVDDSDKPTEDDFCSFAERRTDEQT